MSKHAAHGRLDAHAWSKSPALRVEKKRALFRGIALGFAALALSACAGHEHMSFLSPQGPVAHDEAVHFYWILGIMGVFVAGPIFLALPFLLWRYRYGNTRARYTPRWRDSRALVGFMWGGPILIVCALGFFVWRDSHRLNPYTPIASTQPPLQLQVIGYDWKWLFIYPEQGIATVGTLALPVGRPVTIHLTSATVMQSLFIPALGSQIYAMGGMVTQLNLEATRPGRFLGENTMYNGNGFHNQKFTAVAMSPAAFADWVRKVKFNGVPLGERTLKAIGTRTTREQLITALPGIVSPDGSLYLTGVSPELFRRVVKATRDGTMPELAPAAQAADPPQAADPIIGSRRRGASETRAEPRSTSAIVHGIIGRFTMHALPFYDMVQHPTRENLINGTIAGFAACIAVGGFVIVVGLITWFGKWRYLWTEWFTSVDHKKIGIMYVVLAAVMLARALIEAMLMRAQQAWGLGGGFLSPDHFGQLFSTHGTIMIFFMAMPFLTGVINYVMPLQIGARDVSFPVLNSISLWLTAAGAALVMASLVFGHFSTGGWFGYPPYTEANFQGGVGPDYWIWSLSLAGLGSTLTGINFAVTIYKERAPGMKLFRMPLFTWAALCTAILMIFAMPPLTVATAQLALDRYLGFHYFTNSLGGDMMHFVNLFWIFGHPEVYILIIPAFGIYSEIFSTYSGKALFGYASMVLAIMCIAILSFTVWVHHFFTMGQSPSINAVYGIASMLIGIPTGVKIYDWMWTMFRGRVRITTPMIYAIGFIVLFVLGGMSGIILANPSVDYQVHNTVFLIAHFHNVAVPGVLFGLLAGYHFWFPKAFGFRLNERWGIFAAFCWTLGFMLAFFPLYALGIMGLPRRSVAYQQPAYVQLELVAFAGALLIGVGLAALLIQLYVSVRDREENRVPAGDPWDGRSLEWACSAPPPEYNFPVIPVVDDRDAFTAAKDFGTAYLAPKEYADITLPRNAAMGPIIGALGFAIAFGLVWHIWWLAILATLGVIATMIARGFARDITRTIPAAQVQRQYSRWLDIVHAETPVTRADEVRPVNRGLADQTALRAAS